MSGGSYDYAYRKIQDMADELRLKGNCSCASKAERAAFREHLKLVARACQAIEWNDSCDGDDQEVELVRACIGEGAALSEAIKMAKDAPDLLRSEIDRAEEVTPNGRGK